MNHFNDAVPENRWRNDMLNEIRTTNQLLRQLLERNAQAVEEVQPMKTVQRRGRRKGAVNQ